MRSPRSTTTSLPIAEAANPKKTVKLSIWDSNQRNLPRKGIWPTRASKTVPMTTCQVSTRLSTWITITLLAWRRPWTSCTTKKTMFSASLAALVWPTIQPISLTSETQILSWCHPVIICPRWRGSTGKWAWQITRMPWEWAKRARLGLWIPICSRNRAKRRLFTISQIAPTE